MGYALFRVTGGDCTSECSAGVFRRSTLHESVWVVSTVGADVCWWNGSMERELKGVPRRGPIVWGNMTGAKGSEVGGETHLQERDCCHLPLRGGPWGHLYPGVVPTPPRTWGLPLWGLGF